MTPYASPLRNPQKVRVPQSMDVQSPTLRFFLEGDELEAETRRAALESARAFQNDNGELEARTRDTLILRDRDLGSLNPYDSFENHARTRGALIGLAMLSSLAAMGVAGWMWMTSPSRPGLDWFQRRAVPAVRAFAGSLAPAPAAPTAEHAPAGVPAAATAEPAPAVAAAEPAPAAAEPAALAGAAAPPATAPIVEPIVAAAPVESAPATADQASTTAREQEVATAPAGSRSAARAGEGKALRGYVWSPAAKSLVTSNAAPAGAKNEETTEAATARMQATPAAATRTAVSKTEEPVAVPSNPDAPMPSSLLSGPGIAAPSTGPAPDETARVPTTEPSPFPAPALPETKAGSTAKAAAPIIE